MKNFLLTIMAIPLLIAACRQSTQYPMPTLQEECRIHLYSVLMSEKGRAMNGAELAELTDTGRLKNVFQIKLPLANSDLLPNMATYRDDANGYVISFLPITEEDPLDTIHAVCKAVTDYGYGDGLIDTMLVHNRGNGILTFFRYVHRCGPNGGKHRCYNNHPDGYPEYEATVISVAEGADSLLTSWGYEESKCVFHIEK